MRGGCAHGALGGILAHTAACYGNKRAVGKAIKESCVARGDVFITQNFAIDDSTLTESDMAKIRRMNRYKSLILDITSIDEVHLLHGITFVQ